MLLGVIAMLIVRKLDNSPGPSRLVRVKTKNTGADIEKILSKFGKVNSGSIPKMHLPLNHNFVRIAMKYEKIMFDDNYIVFDRSLMEKPYPINLEYVQIALRDEQDPILIKRKSDDPSVYIINSDEADLGFPDEYVSSFEEYIVMEYNNYREVSQE